MARPAPDATFFSRALIWARVLRPALLVISAVAIVSLGVLVLELRTQLRSFQEEPVDNIHWNVTQLELDIVRFESEARLLTLEPDASLNDLRKRFDLFYSRAQSALQGGMFKQLGIDDIVAPMNKRLSAFLGVLTPIIDSDDPTLRRNLPMVLQNTTTLREDLRTMSVDLIDKYAALADKRRAAFATVLQEVAWSSSALLGVLILLLALVLWLNSQTERNAKENRIVTARLAATVNTSLDAVIVTGRDGLVMDYNTAAATIFGYPREEALGVSLADLIVPPHLRQAHLKGMERMNRTGEMRLVNSGRFQTTAIRKGGAEFPIELSLASTEDTGDMLIIAYLRDISHRVAAEEAVIAARDKALAAELAKTNFMAVMSHEMRTPLNGVMAALEIAARETVDAKQARFLDLARSSAIQLLRHANEVLDISKIDAGGLDLTHEDFDLAELVERLVDALAHVAAQKHTTIEVHALSALPTLRGDSFRLGQILQNFLSNAIKFTDEGKIVIEFDIQDQSPDGVTIELRVTDTGIGIAEADQARVFDDFVMIDPSYGRNSGGTGLGLAISRRLATAMGGEIGVESDLGQGSCFWLRIPFRIGQPRRQLQAKAPANTSVRPLDILVVEDNATNRIVLEEMLVHQGHRVTLAVDGGDGMVKAREHAFDVILMDISMPTMDGLTATEMIRWQGKSKSARIIAITAHSMPEDRERFKAAGMDGYLTKPISQSALEGAIAGLIEVPNHRAASGPILSQARIVDLSSSIGQAALQRIFVQFLRDVPSILARLEASMAADEATQTLKAAHEATGACAMVGADALGDHLSRIEAACQAGDLAAARDLVPDVARLWRETADAIRAHAPD